MGGRGMGSMQPGGRRPGADAAKPASGGADAQVLLWNMTTGISQTLSAREHTDQVWSVAFSPDGKTLATGSFDRSIILWDVETRKLMARLTGPNNIVIRVAFSPDGQILASSSYAEITLWDIATRQPIGQPLVGHSDYVLGLAFSPTGQTLASGGFDGAIHLWDVRTGTISQTLTSYSRIWSLAFSPDGETVASGNDDGTITLWNPATSRSRSLTGHTALVRSVTFSPDGQTLASASEDRSVRLWKVATGEAIGPPLQARTAEEAQAVSSLALSPDGRTLASGGDEGSILLWDTATGKVRGQPLVGHTGGVRSLVFSHDGALLASGGSDGNLLLWNAATGQRLRDVLAEPNVSVNGVVFSPNDRTLAAALSRNQVRFWDVATGAPTGETLRGHTDADVTSLAFSPDGQAFASGDSGGTIILLSASFHRFQQVYAGSVTSLAFSPDGRMLASASNNDSQVILWDVATGQEIGRLNQGTPASSLAFSLDGNQLAVGDVSGAILLWDVTPQAWRTRACQLAIRNLSWLEWSKYIAPTGLPYQPACPGNPIDFSDLANGFGTQARVYVEVGEVEQARAAFQAAVYWAVQAETAAPSVSICRLGSLDFVKEVRAACRNAAQLASDSLTRADMHALAGDTLKASAAFTEAIQSALKSEDADRNEKVCRLGSLDGLAASVLPACNRAIQLALESDRGLYRDSRGLARALTGDYPGAAADFEAYNDWAQAFDGYAERIAIRKDWIEALKAKQNPFADPATLYAIRIELSP